MRIHEKVSTGIPGFDKVIDRLRMGDNVVWQILNTEDYKRVVFPYVEQAKRDRRSIVYIRFGKHEPIFQEEDEIKTYRLNASVGFETFASSVRQILTKEGRRTFYVFDCLTDLLEFWYSDLMIGNFFQVTCPYLYKLDTVAYFCIERGAHTFNTIASIRETTQCLLDLYVIQNKLYLHPLKMMGRYSPTMFFPHLIQGEEATEITSSYLTARLFSNFQWDQKRVDYWNALLDQAKAARNQSEEERNRMKTLLIKIFMGGESRIRNLCEHYFTLEDLLNIASREIGTGLIGGKSVGMLLARKIVKTMGSEEIKEHLEPDDSFFIGTDVFYTYIVLNGWWDLRTRQKTEEGYLVLAEEFHDRLLNGAFPEFVEEEFMHMLEYFGQSPIIVRSSSLLEDNFGNAFAGKYESVFCANQGTPQDRLAAFEDAVRTVYASTMNEDALHYRKIRGLSKKDEQMAILVQRVSGDYYGNYFFPHVAGVGYSKNLYVWNKDMNPEAGMLRLVLGLGTRAVDRNNDDYVRIVPLDDPCRQPPVEYGEERRYQQAKVDLLDIGENSFESVPTETIWKTDLHISSGLFATPDMKEAARLRELGYTNLEVPRRLDFKKLLKGTSFTGIMKEILKSLSEAYENPVDIEFTANFVTEQEFGINLVQCRPLQAFAMGNQVEMPLEKKKGQLLFYSEGDFMGGNVKIPLDIIIYVNTEAYLACTEQKRHGVARMIGKLNEKLKEKRILLIGPGRFGTTTSSLGVPVHFSEISHMSALCEVSVKEKGIMPEVSYGSHFFQDMVETEIFYLALFPDKKETLYLPEKIKKEENRLKEYISDSLEYEQILTVIEREEACLYSDISEQRVMCTW